MPTIKTNCRPHQSPEQPGLLTPLSSRKREAATRVPREAWRLTTEGAVFVVAAAAIVLSAATADGAVDSKAATLANAANCNINLVWLNIRPKALDSDKRRGL